jgi:hypothetical protein
MMLLGMTRFVPHLLGLAAGTLLGMVLMLAWVPHHLANSVANAIEVGDEATFETLIERDLLQRSLESEVARQAMIQQVAWLPGRMAGPAARPSADERKLIRSVPALPPLPGSPAPGAVFDSARIRSQTALVSASSVRDVIVSAARKSVHSASMQPLGKRTATVSAIDAPIRLSHDRIGRRAGVDRFVLVLVDHRDQPYAELLFSGQSMFEWKLTGVKLLD